MTVEENCYHVPVLARELCEMLCWNKGGIYLDATLGGGGHFGMLAGRLDDNARLIGIDRDPDAITWNLEHPVETCATVIIEQGRFSEIGEILRRHDISYIDGAMADLGVSSFQIDNVDRGFSFMKQCRLDMRMNPSEGESASELIERLSVEKLSDILENMGDIRNAPRMAAAIKSSPSPPHTSRDLLECLEREYGHRISYKLAAKVFMALRIAVNDELGELQKFLSTTLEILARGGRMAVISYHSLEDRMVKEFFRNNENKCICPKEVAVCSCGRPGRLKRITRKPVVASENEILHNPRARSARLRVAEKL